MRIDIDAARAARLEAEDDTHEFVFGGQPYTVPAEAPWMFVHHIVRGQIPQALSCAFGEDAWETISKQASKNDVVEIQHRLFDVWGMGTPGESPASSSSSPDGGASSRPISNGSTGSTSATSGAAG